MSAPERIWAAHADGLREYDIPISRKEKPSDYPFAVTEYIRADLVQAMVDDAMKRALYATRDRTWSGVEALISDPAALRAIGEGEP